MNRFKFITSLFAALIITIFTVAAHAEPCTDEYRTDPAWAPICKSIDSNKEVVAAQNLMVLLSLYPKPTPADLEAFNEVMHNLPDLDFTRTWMTLQTLSDQADGMVFYNRVKRSYERMYPGEYDRREARLFDDRIVGRLAALMGEVLPLPGFGLLPNENPRQYR